MMRFGVFVFSAFLLSCQANGQHGSSISLETFPEGTQRAYFASGCFWCVEAIFESVHGVYEAESGYSGGVEKNPTYRQVSYGQTSHAEAVQVFYNPNQISFQDLVAVYFASHDPTTKDRQGPDRGSQYRSIAFYQNETEKMIIEEYIRLLEESGMFKGPIVTEIKEFDTFYPAEEYHQNYEKNNPNDPYVRAVSIPRINTFKERMPQFLKENH